MLPLRTMLPQECAMDHNGSIDTAIRIEEVMATDMVTEEEAGTITDTVTEECMTEVMMGITIDIMTDIMIGILTADNLITQGGMVTDTVTDIAIVNLGGIVTEAINQLKSLPLFCRETF